MAPALVKPIGPDSSCTGVEPISKFDGQQLCSPSIYRPHIFIIERSKLIIKCVKISRGLQHFKGRYFFLKVTPFECAYSVTQRKQRATAVCGEFYLNPKEPKVPMVGAVVLPGVEAPQQMPQKPLALLMQIL